MIKTEFKTYMKEVKEEIATHMYCDYCGKEIENHTFYVNVVSSHDDWGNDSIDSYKDADLHQECWQKYINELFSEKYICASLKNKNNWQIKIETEHCDLISGEDDE